MQRCHVGRLGTIVYVAGSRRPEERHGSLSRLESDPSSGRNVAELIGLTKIGEAEVD
jgi:hypothetical protein